MGAFNEGDIDGYLVTFGEDAVLHGGDGQIEGRDAIRSVVEQLRALTENTLHIEVHDVLANDNHTVILQLTKGCFAARTADEHSGEAAGRIAVQFVGPYRASPRPHHHQGWL
jgi:ketosteroid isomerase-like protein